MKSRGHIRLLTFFVVVAAVGGAIGVLGLRRAEDASERAWAVVLAVGFTAGVGFSGVLYHRVKVIKARWVETEKYLERIRRESEKYQAILEGAADMLLLVDPPNGRVLERNAMARTRLAWGRSEGEFVLDDVLAEADRPRMRAALATSLDSANGSSIDELHLYGFDGRSVIADARLAAIVVEDRRVIQVSLRDLTLQKQIEQQLQIHERLSSVGLMTAGVAHEINNPLEAIGNYLSLLERPNLSPETRARYLESVRHGFSRIREIVRDLLRFARPVQGEGDADLSRVVAQALKLVGYSKQSAAVTFERRGLDAPLWVVGDEGRLEQVIVNLLINAAKATDARGHVELAARTVRSPSDGAEWVELCVDDNGPGIAPTDLERIFDPFFTTTGGTGLGLSVSYGIIQAHGGTLRAENRTGGGARFVVRLPLKRAAVEATVRDGGAA